MNSKIFTEVLAPVGNEEMLTAAVRSGADAVYLGAKEFSARRNAENFDDTALKNAVEYCHIRGVKVYLTLNILIKDSEMSDAVSLAKTAYNYGVDGVIIEDLGLAAVLKGLLPLLPLHASTQMSVHSPAALSLLKSMGFSRVVAAREMSYAQLKELCEEAQRLDMEIEVFVHGALCMSVSGQCLLSAFLGSRSGNRGLCAGPCRLPFSVDNGTGYDLSLKDLSLLPHIKKLCEMGVISFKIEGRMKRPEYVAAATAACRKAVDSGFVPPELDSVLKGVFSRSGFTDGYFTDNLGRDMFGIRTKEDVTAAAKALPQIHDIYRNERQSVEITALLTVKRGEKLSLMLNDGENSVTVYGNIPETAQNKAATEESLLSGIDKFGSTPYKPQITVQCDDGLFVRASDLNALRREAAEMLDKKRAEITVSQSSAVYNPVFNKARAKKQPKVYARFENKGQIPDDLSGINGIIYPLERDIDFALPETRLIVDIPRGITNESVIRNRLKAFRENGFKAALCGNLSALVIAKEEGFDIIADSGINTYNSETVEVLNNIGVKGAVLSNEITLNDAALINSDLPLGIIAYGNIPLMLFKNCPLKNGRNCADCDKNGVITDRKNISFPVRCRMGYSEMLNSVPVWLADRKEELRFADFYVLYFTREAPERVKEVITAYKKGAAADTDYTRGLFYRGTV